MFRLDPILILPFLPQLILYIVVLITMIRMLYRYRKDNLSLLILLMYYPALYAFLGVKISSIMKIVVLGMSIWCVMVRKSLKLTNLINIRFVCIFGMFLLAFFMSVANSASNTFTIVLSQLARYIEYVCLYFLIQDAVFRRNQSQQLLQLFYEIIWIQILASIMKLILFGGLQLEAFVGTISLLGGAAGTSIPILGFIILYVYREGNLSKKDWLYVIGLLLLAYTSAKRAVWFILPIVIAAFLIYVRGIKLNKYMILGICAAPIVFYFGARLTPNLNPENKVWGSFDVDYIFDFAETYQFGKEGLEGYIQEEVQVSRYGGQYSIQGGIEAEGRGGATLALLELLFSPKYKLKDQDIYGLGFSGMYSTDYDTFIKLPLTIHINHKGSATGVFQSYVTTGYLGVFTTILLMFFPFFFFKHKRLQWVILAILAWEYFMYTGIVFRTPAFMAILLFVLHYTNKQYEDYRVAKRAFKVQQLAEREAHRKQLLEAAEAETT